MIQQYEVLTISAPCFNNHWLAHALGNAPNFTYFGNINLIQMPITALFCSKKCPGDAILKAYNLAQELCERETPVIGGFHTPVEKDMLEILLKGRGPIVMCPARGLEGMRMPKVWNQAIQQGRFALLSMFDHHIHRATKETAHQRNFLVAALAKDHVFIHIEPGGETEKVAILISGRVF